MRRAHAERLRVETGHPPVGLVSVGRNNGKIDLMRRYLRGRPPPAGRGVAAIRVAQEVQSVFAAARREGANGVPWFAFGHLRIVGECAKLGVAVSATSVRNILRRHRLRPGATARRAYPGGVPPDPGGGRAGLRPVHRGDGRTDPAVRAVLIEVERRRVWLAG